jgi:hypothetical protein
MESQQLSQPDHSRIELGNSFNCRFRSFKLLRGYFIGHFVNDEILISAVIGKTTDLSISAIFKLKENLFELTYRGVNVSTTSGNSYTNWSVKKLDQVR